MNNNIDTDNICLKTDSYKLNHWNQYPEGTETVYSYFESRNGAKWDETVFFGLQYKLLTMGIVGKAVTKEKIDEAEKLCEAHFGDKSFFNREGWEYILNKHDGKLPIRIKAVPEGNPVDVSNVLMTIENTDPKCFWLTNFLETELTHIWYSSTVATLSREVKKLIKKYQLKTTGEEGMLDFMLHDFGCRGVTTNEAAGIGGLSHLVNFVGTDTVIAMLYAQKYYDANLNNLAFSVAATEHSIMTSYGPENEAALIKELLEKYSDKILSMVSDSYDIENVVKNILPEYKSIIEKRQLPLVIRPDSLRHKGDTPEDQMVWIIGNLMDNFGYSTNEQGYKVLPQYLRVLWGDGIDIDGVEKILNELEKSGFASSNVATFGMGGGLLQKINRDTQRFAFKCSAQKRNGQWLEISKKPLDESKASKKGRLGLTKLNNKWITYNLDDTKNPNHGAKNPNHGAKNYLETVYENGELIKIYSLDEIRENAKI